MYSRVSAGFHLYFCLLCWNPKQNMLHYRWSHYRRRIILQNLLSYIFGSMPLKSTLSGQHNINRLLCSYGLLDRCISTDFFQMIMCWSCVQTLGAVLAAECRIGPSNDEYKTMSYDEFRHYFFNLVSHEMSSVAKILHHSSPLSKTN